MDADIITAIDDPDLLSRIILLDCTCDGIRKITDAEHGPDEVDRSTAAPAVLPDHRSISPGAITLYLGMFRSFGIGTCSRFFHLRMFLSANRRPLRRNMR
jgi:hypothetical protein